MTKLVDVVVSAGSMSSGSQPILTVDAALSLRPFLPSDAPAVVEAYTTPDIERFNFHRLDTDDEAMEWIEARADEWTAEKGATWAVAPPPSSREGTAQRPGGRSRLTFWKKKNRAIANGTTPAATPIES